METKKVEETKATQIIIPLFILGRRQFEITFEANDKAYVSQLLEELVPNSLKANKTSAFLLNILDFKSPNRTIRGFDKNGNEIKTKTAHKSKKKYFDVNGLVELNFETDFVKKEFELLDPAEILNEEILNQNVENQASVEENVQFSDIASLVKKIDKLEVDNRKKDQKISLIQKELKDLKNNIKNSLISQGETIKNALIIQGETIA